MLLKKRTLLAAFLLCFLTLGFAEHTYAEGGYSRSKSASTSVPVLYYSNSCPHCDTVLNYLKKNNKSVTMKNVGNPQNRQEWKALGRTGVPVLVVNGRVIVGSTPIIKYLSSY